MKDYVRRLVLCGIVVTAAIAGPFACQHAASPAERQALHKAPGLTHVVIIWLKDPHDAATRDRVIEASQSLKQIPGALDVQVGRMLPSTRPVVDSTYDVGVVFSFADERAMKEYLANPAHLKVLNEVLKPAADHYRVFDFVTP